MKALVTVTLKEGILDTQGRAVQGALGSIAGGIRSVRMGKHIEIDLAETDPEKARAAVTAMCDKLLANPVTENYAVELVDG